ncbi:MAG: PhoH family protein [Alphaproteobacteria bacterium]|nr:PhoH family protein [Alphaproteobacteria bacterium]
MSPPGPADDAGLDERTLHVQFDDNALLPLVYGLYDQHLARIEQTLGVTLSSRGNRLAIGGPAGAARQARAALDALYARVKRGHPVDLAEVDAAVRLARQSETGEAGGRDEALVIRTPRRHLTPRSAGQAAYLRALADHALVFALGPAGTGKTYLAVASAVAMMNAGKVDRIVLSRPAVEAGERLGFLPGDMREKVDPYLRPLYDALFDMLPGDQVARKLASGEIEVAPLAFMRGRTLSNAFVILDEAQNATKVQMRMFLTRLGDNACMVVTGDLSQSDLPSPAESGLRDAIETLAGIEGIARVEFTDADVVRHPLVARIVRAYDESDRLRKRGTGERSGS